MGSFDLFALVWAGPFIVAFMAIDVIVFLDNWRHDRREGSGGDGQRD